MSHHLRQEEEQLLNNFSSSAAACAAVAAATAAAGAPGRIKVFSSNLFLGFPASLFWPARGRRPNRRRRSSLRQQET